MNKIIPAVFLIIVLILAFLLFQNYLPQGTAPDEIPTKTGLYRFFSSETASPGDAIKVDVKVVVASGEEYYLVEEYAPRGWTVKMQNHTMDNRLTFYVLQNARNTTYSYDAVAPSKPGQYEFHGFYMFGGMEEPVNISGKRFVTVV